MTKPVVISVPSLHGAEYGFKSIDEAKKMFPDAVAVRYQDGSPLEADDGAKPVSKMNRDELEVHAISLGIENPSEFANVGELRDAIAGVENG